VAKPHQPPPPLELLYIHRALPSSLLTDSIRFAWCGGVLGASGIGIPVVGFDF